jgi:hypothetical protein
VGVDAPPLSDGSEDVEAKGESDTASVSLSCKREGSSKMAEEQETKTEEKRLR